MTKKRRYFLSAGILVACGCLALGVFALIPPQPGISKANFDRVEIGMAEAELDKLFEPDAGNPKKAEFFLGGQNVLPQFVGKRMIFWEGSEGEAHFTLDKNNRVEELTWRYYESSTFKRLIRRVPPN